MISMYLPVCHEPLSPVPRRLERDKAVLVACPCFFDTIFIAYHCKGASDD
jgi:hypothetical protein